MDLRRGRQQHPGGDIPITTPPPLTRIYCTWLVEFPAFSGQLTAGVGGLLRTHPDWFHWIAPAPPIPNTGVPMQTEPADCKRNFHYWCSLWGRWFA